jgi:peptidoglycan/LPS O-acetylase OafA/YrhL
MNHSLSERPSPLLRPFFPALDGLRALAFLAVFLTHYVAAIVPWAPLRWGWTGVDLFFTLSGFLITGILFDSLHERRYFRDFYIRRSLRIFPLFYGFWIAMLLLTPILHILWNRYNFALMAYIGNSFIAGSSLGHHPDPTQIAVVSSRHPGELRYISVGHLWTLCVEEQFYLVWPAVVYFIRSRRALMALCLVWTAALPFARIFFAHYHPDLVGAGFLYNSTWSHSDGLMAGAFLALWFRGSSVEPGRLVRYALVVLLLSVVVLVATCGPGSHDWPDGDLRVSTVSFTLITLASSAILVLVLASRVVQKVLEVRPLMAMGRISYGLYFFHAIPVNYVAVKVASTKSPLVAWLIIIATFLGTYLLAWLSYRFFESYFLRLKSKLAPRPHAVSDPPANPHELDRLLPSAE